MLNASVTVQLADMFRLLGDPNRLRVVLYCLSGPKSVGDIARHLELSQTLVSHHLRLLRAARLVRGTRRSRQVFYELADHHVSGMLLDMARHVCEDCGDADPDSASSPETQPK